ncbi:MAG: alpha/beta hydrolase, partial [Planctomycetaceae bacterium]
LTVAALIGYPACVTAPSESFRHPWRRTTLRLSALVVIPYVFVAGMFIGFQRSLLYPALQSEPLPAADYAMSGIRLDDVETATADGLTLHGWYARPTPIAGEPALRPVVLYLHGNGGHRVHRLDDLDLLTGCGASVLLFDYRGYGENAGEPSEQGLTLDARAMWDYATKELDVPPERIVLFGESLGGGVAVELAAAQCEAGTPPGGLILRSTFSSMTDAASHHYPWLPIRLALLDRYDSKSCIGNVTCPILSLHGDADEIVPLALGQKLFDAAPRQSASGVDKRFVLLSGAGHNDVIDAARGAFDSAVTTFLRDVTTNR